MTQYIAAFGDWTNTFEITTTHGRHAPNVKDIDETGTKWRRQKEKEKTTRKKCHRSDLRSSAKSAADLMQCAQLQQTIALTHTRHGIPNT